MMGVEVTVKCGPYARYKGRVKQETVTHLQLELDAINRWGKWQGGLAVKWTAGSGGAVTCCQPLAPCW